MALENNFNIQQFLSLDGYEQSRLYRRKNSEINSQEFFTPYLIVKKMCDKVPESDWADPNKTFLEPSQGNGQFTIFILYRRIHEYNIPWRKALETMYTCELMEDNVQESRQRVHELLRNIATDYDPKVADEIMDKNFVCHDFFTWDFENWCEKKEEKKPKKIQKDLFEKFKFPKPKKVKQENIDKPKKKKIVKDNSKQLEINFA